MTTAELAGPLTARPTGPALRCAGLVRIYRSATGETHALRGVDAEFTTGQLTGVLGPSGCGKSSLLSVLALQEKADGGELEVLGASTTALAGPRLRAVRRRVVSWIAQRPGHGLFPHLSAADHVRMAHARRGGDGPVDPEEVLDRVDLAARAGSLPVQLSGGEQQRLAVATALVGGPRVVVADEPTAELDDESAAAVVRALTVAARDGACVVVATHDARLVAGADRVLLMRHGVLATDRDAAGGDATAVVDSAGRLQLPVEALELLGDRAVVRVMGDHVRLEPPAGRP